MSSSQDESDVCYICLEKATKRNKFHNTKCGCTGSNKIHIQCYENLIMSKGNAECCICKRTMIEFCKNFGLQIMYKPISDKLMAKYTVNADGVKQGVYSEIYRETRDVRLHMMFEKGLAHGEMSIWRFDRSVHIQGNWVRGKKHGEWMEFEADPMLGYTIVIYCHDVLVEYYKYNYLQELIDHENYSASHMKSLAAEIDAAMFSDVIGVI